MNTSGSEIKILAGNSSKELAQKIADYIGVPLADCEVGTFSDGEISVNMNETVRGCDVFVVQSTNSPVNENLMELLIMIDALKRASAGRITAVIPYYGYARQDRKAKARDPITAKLVANLITAAGADRVLTMDLHAAQIQGYFDIPLDHLLGGSLLANYFNKKNIEDLVVVSPDLGSVTRSRKFANQLDGEVPLAIIDKRRPKANVCEVMNLIGDVNGKNVIMLDDMIDTAGTITNAANALKEFGAKDIYACCTHAVLSGPAIERIENSAISELIVLDTIRLPKEKEIDKIGLSTLERSFKALVYANLLSADANPQSIFYQRLKADIRYILLDQGLHYLEKEEDTTGFSSQYGWVHAFAHGADLLTEVVCHPDFSASQMYEVLEILGCMFKKISIRFTDDEDWRLARVIYEPILQGKLDQEQVASWIKAVDFPIEERVDFYKFSNFRSCLLEVYVQLDQKNILQADLKEAIQSFQY